MRVLSVSHTYNFVKSGKSQSLQPGEYKIPEDVPADVADEATLRGYAIIKFIIAK